MSCEINEVHCLEYRAHSQYFNYESATIRKLFKSNIISDVSSKTRDVLRTLSNIHDGLFLGK